MTESGPVRLTKETLNSNRWARAYKSSRSKPKVHVIGCEDQTALCNKTIYLLMTEITGNRLRRLPIDEFCKNCLSKLEKGEG